MKLTHIRPAVRPGFTIIEIVVVIAIIAVLASLTTSAVMKFIKKGPEVQNMTELRQLEASIAAFNKDFNLTNYFPSRLMLCESFNDYPTTGAQAQLANDSKKFLLRLYPRMQAYWTAKGIDWNGNGKIDRGAVILDGDQCLVFFLGGIPSQTAAGNSCQGFSRIASNPAQPGGDRKGPYFNFQSGRLKLLHGNNSPYFSYQDAHELQPYLYFSSNRTRDGYNAYGSTDCPAAGVWPYHDGAHYLKPDSFQIISAGADGKFGPGTNMMILPAAKRFYWNANAFGNMPEAGKDDQTNFADGILGAGP